MGKVTVLSEEIISKIAAGEVIERPASVIKELVENSLDAGADDIEVKLLDAGKKSIIIKDNGSGIEKDDLEKIFLRHATSKIKTSDDLFDIHSLGFRGEALYSIAAIADIILNSKTNGQDSGWEIHMRAGHTLNMRPSSFNSTGTEIEIRELFFNTPARKKFLKSNTTEIHQILNTFIPYTLLYPARRFRLKHQDRDLVYLPPTGNNFKARFAQTLNLDEKHLLETFYEDASLNLKIRLVIGDINVKRARRDLQYIFVNSRPVQNKNIAFHLNQIFRLVMPEDFFPAFACFIETPASEVDVNIHPTKREVKLRNENQICTILRQVAEGLLMKKSDIKQASQPSSLSFKISDKYLAGHYAKEKSFDTSGRTELLEESHAHFSKNDYAYPKNPENAELFTHTPELFSQKNNSLQAKFENACYIGCFMNKFLFFENTSSLLIIDQHAAAERITFEMLIKQMQKNTIEVQKLLVPIIIPCSPQELLLWEDLKETLDACGFENNQWDEQAIAVHSHPLLIKDTEKAVREILSGGNIDKNDFETLARRACRSSIMAGDKLAKEQVEHLRHQLLECVDPFTCPHGRPTVIEMSENFLDEQFLRT